MTIGEITQRSISRRGWHAVIGIGIVTGLSALYREYNDNSHYPIRQHVPPAEPLQPSSAGSTGRPARHALDDAIDFIEPGRIALQEVRDYTAVFSKTELVNGEIVANTMDMKFRQEPFSVYLRRHSKRGDGREILYVTGKYDGKMLVREGGLKAIVGTMELDMYDHKIMDTCRHPITDIGMANLLASAITIWKSEKETLDPGNIQVGILRSVTVGDTECEAIEIAHRESQPGLIYQVGRVYLDKQSHLPVRAEMYGWPTDAGDEPPLLEQYTYSNVRINIGLTEADFDRQNPDYRFEDR